MSQKTENGSPKIKKRWNWKDLQKTSHDTPQTFSPSSSQDKGLKKFEDSSPKTPSTSSPSSSHDKGKRKRSDEDSEDEQRKRDQTVDDIYQK